MIFQKPFKIKSILGITNEKFSSSYNFHLLHLNKNFNVHFKRSLSQYNERLSVKTNFCWYNVSLKQLKIIPHAVLIIGNWVQNFAGCCFMLYEILRSPSLSELTLYWISLGLTHLGSEASMWYSFIDHELW